MTDHETFYDLLRAVEETKATHQSWQERLASSNRRDRIFSHADWGLLYRAKAAYEAALLAMAEFQARIDGQLAAADAERTAA